jgi:hypothetical protein|tara:strand:+ start:2066 stop:2500 length:435 start_codon:yes stop_codon:yes gene_type:complete
LTEEKEITVEEAVDRYANILDAIRSLNDDKDRYFAIIHSHMTDTGAKVLPHPRYVVSIPVKRAYDPNKFLAEFGEVMPEDEFAEVYSPAFEEEVVKKTPARVNGMKAKKLWDMGEGVVAKLERTLIPQRPEIKLEAKEKREVAL